MSPSVNTILFHGIMILCESLKILFVFPLPLPPPLKLRFVICGSSVSGTLVRPSPVSGPSEGCRVAEISRRLPGWSWAASCWAPKRMVSVQCYDPASIVVAAEWPQRYWPSWPPSGAEPSATCRRFHKPGRERIKELKIMI